MNFYAVTALYVTIGGLGVGIFLWGKPEGNSLFDRLYQLVCVWAPRALKKALGKCFGPRAPAFLDWLWNYLCYTSNPLIQIFYLCIVVGGFMTFVTHGFPHLPNRFIGSIHKYTGFSVYVTCLTTWWKASSSDPGTVTSANVDYLSTFYEWDEQIFTNSECKTCDLAKPARSKHCSLCNVCVAKFDHHCIWINNCVGVNNHKWFLGFLYAHCVLCFYGLGVGTTIAWDLIVQRDLFNAVFVDPTTREKHKATYIIIAQYMLATEGMLIFVTLLCCVMGFVLFGFFLWHLNLVRTGTTTNELSKWQYLKWCLKDEGEEGKAKIKQLKNIYNKGFAANMREVLFQIDVHAPPRNGASKPAAATGSGSRAGGRKGNEKLKKG
jgi:palmitoyltransferase